MRLFRQNPTDSRPLLPVFARVLAAMAAACAIYLALRGATPGRGSLVALWGHILFFGASVAAGTVVLPPSRRAPVALLGALTLLAGAGSWLPLLSPQRSGLVYLHVLLGAVATAGLLQGAAPAPPRRSLVRKGVVGTTVILLVLYGLTETRRARWSPPEYEARACYRFLTATTPAQSGEPLFPSALRVRGPRADGCAAAGCHERQRLAWTGSAHGTGAASGAYRATLADFTRRRGPEATRWCAGCHEPSSEFRVPGSESQVPSPRHAARSTQHAARTKSLNPQPAIGCEVCHAARDVHALYGSATLEVGPGVEGGLVREVARLLPKSHSQGSLRPAMHRSAEFCASCHRKNWNLPQNDYGWMPGPDEYRDWQASRFSGASLFAAGSPAAPRSCTGCHDPHGEARVPGEAILGLSAYLRRARDGGSEPLGAAAPPRPGEPATLDLVVSNRGIGHGFPTGMPDLNESWLEVILHDRSGRPVAGSGRLSPESDLKDAHRYRLVGLDREGREIPHGDLDRMVAVGEWRRILPGEADLARYRLTVPPGGLGAVGVRVLRRRRPEFRAWAGEPPEAARVLASVRIPVGVEHPEHGAVSWREYGLALAAARAYPQAIQALRRALEAAPGDPETLLALGRVYLEEGDLLDAREQFRRAGGGAAERARAWEGAVLRRMGQPDEAARLLAPLARRWPRDRKLRFELGLAYLSQLRNDRAAREFEAMLAVDPTDVSAHYNLMLCWQRLGRFSQARTEEAVYRLFAQPAPAPRRAPGSEPPVEERPLHEHRVVGW